MNIENPWLLPQGIEEVLPAQAEHIDQLCRGIVDCMHSWGYELVMPPLIDYIESLLTGAGNDLDLKTFKLTDQISGRMMGVRADMTPQVARMDAHSLKRDTPTRLCYVGQVLHTRAEGFAGNRSPLQLGAELYGYAGMQSDIEVIQLLIESLKVAGVTQVYLDLGHVGVFRGLVEQAGLNSTQQAQLFDVMQRKALPELGSLLSDWNIAHSISDMFLQLIELNGDASTISQARQGLAGASESVISAIESLALITAELERLLPEVKLNIDFAELRGYHYHTGLVFCAYLGGHGQGVAWGGRYDDIGAAFGRARPATGFSLDLNALINLGTTERKSVAAISAPYVPGDARLQSRIAELRDQGERVIQMLPEQNGSPQDLGCTRKLIHDGGDWKTVVID